MQSPYKFYVFKPYGVGWIHPQALAFRRLRPRIAGHLCPRSLGVDSTWEFAFWGGVGPLDWPIMTSLAGRTWPARRSLPNPGPRRRVIAPQPAGSIVTLLYASTAGSRRSGILLLALRPRGLPPTENAASPLRPHPPHPDQRPRGWPPAENAGGWRVPDGRERFFPDSLRFSSSGP